nr:WecB/TagA/CpsF family glycosyltransferase [Aureimonas leprariae]
MSAVNLASATALIGAAVAQGRRGYVCVRDAHGVVRCQTDPELRSIHNRAFLVTPDGMPLVWALKMAGHGECGRVYGPDLMLAVFAAGEATAVRHFLYGATPRTLELLQARLLERFPAARIAGAYAPPFGDLRALEAADVAEQINRSGADIVWVGLGSPKQELWMAHMRHRLDASMLIGVGAAFDFHAGVKRQAPKIVRGSGFEWAFRLLSEPRRLWKRYAVVVPTFLVLAALQGLKLRRVPLEEAHDASSGRARGLGAAAQSRPPGAEAPIDRLATEAGDE